MATNLFRRYVWLANTIYQAGERGITLTEIDDLWIVNDMSCGESLPRKTYDNHKRAIEEIFEINIGCHRSAGYRYYIENSDSITENRIRQWLINSFAVSNLISESHKLKSRIQFEEIPSGQEYLTSIIKAMRDGHILDVDYQPFWGERFTMQLHPYFVKVFRQRWYVIGYNPYNDDVRIYSLDRIEELSLTEQKFTLPDEFSPDDYFSNCFGVDYDNNPQRVVLKISDYQANFVRALPLHHSQKEEETTTEYAVFSYFLCPHTYDFKQAVFSLMTEVEVLEPQSLRDEMKTMTIEMSSKYVK